MNLQFKVLGEKTKGQKVLTPFISVHVDLNISLLLPSPYFLMRSSVTPVHISKIQRGPYFLITLRYHD